MANFIAKKLNSEEINDGTEYIPGDTPQSEAVNTLVRGVMFLNENAFTKDNINELVDSVIKALPPAEGGSF